MWQGGGWGTVCSVCWCLAFRRLNDLPIPFPDRLKARHQQSWRDRVVGRSQVWTQGAGLAKSRGWGNADRERRGPACMARKGAQNLGPWRLCAFARILLLSALEEGLHL